jgi:C_GCAxxG_C_C family probable redox protein
MNKQDYARELFSGHLNCAQSVLSAFSSELEMDITTLQKVGANFGGGMGEGETCGAVTAAFMIMGLKYGTDQSSIHGDKEKLKQILTQYKEMFTKKFVSLNCKDLIGYNVKMPEEQKMAIEKKVFNTKCPLFVSGSVEILENLIK